MDYWIVTERRYRRHYALWEAERERADEMKKDGVQRRVLRCKPNIKNAGHFPQMVAVLKAILADVVTDANRARAQALLESVSSRAAGGVSPAIDRAIQEAESAAQ